MKVLRDTGVINCLAALCGQMGPTCQWFTLKLCVRGGRDQSGRLSPGVSSLRAVYTFPRLCRSHAGVLFSSAR